MDQQGAEMWMRSGREIGGSYDRFGSPLEALSALDPPPQVLHVYGQPHDPTFLEAQQRFADEHEWFGVVNLGDVRTHFSMIDAPGAVAEAIEEFVAAG